MVLDPKLEFLGFVCIVLALANVLQIIFLYGLEQAELKSVQNGNNNSINKVFAEKKKLILSLKYLDFFWLKKSLFIFPASTECRSFASSKLSGFHYFSVWDIQSKLPELIHFCIW